MKIKWKKPKASTTTSKTNPSMETERATAAVKSSLRNVVCPKKDKRKKSKKKEGSNDQKTLEPCMISIFTTINSQP